MAFINPLEPKHTCGFKKKIVLAEIIVNELNKHISGTFLLQSIIIEKLRNLSFMISSAFQGKMSHFIIYDKLILSRSLVPCKPLSISSNTVHYSGQEYQLQSNDPNDIPFNARVRLKSPCIPPVQTVHVVIRSTASAPLSTEGGA